MNVIKKGICCVSIAALLLGSGYFLWRSWKAFQKDKEANEIVEISEKAVKEVKEKSKDKSPLEVSRELLAKLRKDYGTDNIKGFIDTGEGGIKEPFVYSEDDKFLWDSPKGVYDGFGTVFLYKYNESAFDDATTYFGHCFENFRPIKFTKIGFYPQYKDVVKEMDIYTDEGIMKYKLAFVTQILSKDYDTMVTWTKDGMRDFFIEAKSKGTVLDDFRPYNEDAKYALLSACAEFGGRVVSTAVYELVEIQK